MEIRPLADHDEYRAVERLQADVWSLPDVEIVPLHVLITAAKNGGLLLGAFDGARLVGFVFGFPGLTPDGRLKHCSHMAGVHPDYRDQNLGYRLKLAQREHVLVQGIDLITWTFDPLEARNAWLNFGKLGAVCSTYLRNVYGNMRDGLNSGLPSDRLQVDWWIRSERVERRLCDEDDLPSRVSESEILRIPIPADFQAVKVSDMTLALRWRMETRHAFEWALVNGLVVVDVIRDADSCCYFLRA